MSVRKGGQIIAGTPRTTGGIEIGDIGIAPFGIDESLNLRRYLNGQVISQEQFQSFTTKIKARIALFPNLGTTEDNWQAELALSVLGQCGKFVIDDEAGTIRLPKAVNINSLQDLALIGGIKAQTLPNISGKTGFVLGGSDENSGAFSSIQKGGYNGGTAEAWKTDFNASRSSSAYQDGAPVQQEAVQYPYFIQVATGSEESLPAIREYKLNNPHFFGQSMWTDVDPNNASWLISNGAYHSGATYVDYYQWLLKIHNGVETVDGVSVKGVSDEYTDYDFVINTADTTFRLPLLNGEEDLPDYENGLSIASLPFTAKQKGTVSLRLTRPDLSAVIFVNGVEISSDGLPNQSGAAINTIFDVKKGDVVTANQAISRCLFFPNTGNGSLYFYVGDTLQDASLINAGGVLSDVAELKGHAIVEEYHNGTDGYRIWSNGFIEQWGKTVRPISETEITLNFLIPFKDTDYIYVDSIQSTGFYAGVFNMRWVQNTGRTTTSIQVWSASDTSRNWFACGYIR